VTQAGFYIILRLIGYAQAGRTVTPELATRGKRKVLQIVYHELNLSAGPLPRFEGIHLPALSPLQAQSSGGPIPIPRLSPEKANQYATLFEQSGAQDGALDGKAYT
jgi:epidermal growth factor receptor substrate 15